MTKIISVNYALASTYSLDDEQIIELNYKLSDPLRQKILDHELRHSQGNYNKEDFKNDFQSKNSYFLESLKFSLMFPECLIGFFPLLYSYYFKRFTYNSSSVFPFIWFGIIFSAFFGVLFKINFLKAFIGFTIIILILNLILLILTHIRVKKQKNFQYQEIAQKDLNLCHN